MVLHKLASYLKEENWTWKRQVTGQADLCFYYPLCSMVEHLLPGRVKLTFVILQQPLLSKWNSLLCSTQHFGCPLKILSRSLGFQLCLKIEKSGLETKECSVMFRRSSRTLKTPTPALLFPNCLLRTDTHFLIVVNTAKTWQFPPKQVICKELSHDVRGQNCRADGLQISTQLRD